MKSDDCSLDPQQRQAVETRARELLSRADAWGIYPTPIEQLLEAANLQVAPSKTFDPAAILSYLKAKATDAGRHLKSAIKKVFGIYDAGDQIIHIDNSVVPQKQSFLKLHETGHHEIPHHRKTFRIFEDCEQTLSPEIADLFEREANNFARFAMFQGDAYARMAADHELSVKSHMSLAKTFGASQYASAREFARTNHRECLVIVLNKPEFCAVHGVSASVRRIVGSPSFQQKFAMPDDEIITPDHALGPLLPVGKRRMAPAIELAMEDRNGDRHECLAESFYTGHNVLILLYTKRSLAMKTTIIMPPGVQHLSNSSSRTVA